MNGLVRLIIIGLAGAILGLPLIFLKLDMVGSPIIIMFSNIIFPIILGAFFVVGGPYDYLAEKVYARMN